MADLLQFPPPLLFPPESLDERQDLPPNPAPDELRLSDSEDRRAALDIHRSWVVEAPAGSGKTGLLIQRFLKLLAQGDLQRPQEILAITFTRKAAHELRTRVLEQLAAAAANHPLPAHAGDYERATRELATAALQQDRNRGWRLLDSPHQLNIRTIDSFCGDLAGRVPLLSRGAGQRAPLEDSKPLYLEAAQRSFGELGGPDQVLNDALRCVLLHRDAQIGDCVRLVADMLANRDQWGKLVPLGPEVLDDALLDAKVRPRLERTLERAVCGGLSRAARAMDPALLSELTLFAARLGVEPGYKDKDSPIAVCAGRPHPPGTTVEHLDHWLALLNLVFTADNSWRSSTTSNHLGFEIGKPDREWLKQLVGRIRLSEQHNPDLHKALCALRKLPPPCYPDEQWRVAKALFRVLRRALAELTVLFNERSVCDFAEISLTARALLTPGSASADLLHVPGAQLSHLLVDEMQDTSNSQYELLQLLTRDWDGRTQTLFLVGDPKQSIYGFRQACVERFLRTQTSRHLGTVPLGALRLTANFRSQAALVNDFNDTFSRILPPPTDADAPIPDDATVPFVAATAVRSAGVKPALSWHTHLQPSDGSDEDPDHDPDIHSTSADDDARSIRAVIEDFVARWGHRPVPIDGKWRPPRIAVLARNRAHFAPLIAEFRHDRGQGVLPFRAVEIEVLTDRPEVLDLLALTRALLHPGDRVAWLALLRSPVCGLALADLLALTGEGPESESEATVAHLVETRAHLLSAEGQYLLHRAWSVLANAQANLGRTPLSTHVERTWRSLGADAPLRPDQLTNARRYLRLLQELEAGIEPLSLSLLGRRLGRLYAEPFSGPAAVELMTIHKSKGLEWDLVLVPALERQSGTSRHELLKWLELDSDTEADAGVIFAPIQSKGDKRSSLSGWLAGLQKTRETEEAKRLFYVACTRAREELHLFATCKQKQSGELCRPRPETLLGASWAAAEPIFFERLAQPQSSATHTSAHAVGLDHLADDEPLALAAAAEAPSWGSSSPPVPARYGVLQRLPRDFRPLDRFQPEAGAQLPYPPASALRHGAPFSRPEGSFAARSFGNVVHRFLELAAERLASGSSPEDLRRDLPNWRSRILTSFRTEGVSASIAQRDADRALDALRATFSSPEGVWLLSPHASARSERPLQPAPDSTGALPPNLRADRVFLAGADPLSAAETHLWIVDFKTAEPGSRSPQAFLEAEKLKYLPQMQAYARATQAAGLTTLPITLALFYPALTHLLYWTFDPFMASQQIESATDTVPR